MSERTRTPARRDGGFALLVLLGILGVGSLGIVLAVEQFLPPLADRAKRVEANLVAVTEAAREAYLRNGAFPANLNTLANAGGFPVDGRWRLDPFGAVQDLGYTVARTGLTVRSRGTDGRLNTADDVVFSVPNEDELRRRQRARLRLLRALLVRSPYRYKASMSASEVAQMRAAMRDAAAAKREWREADTARRAELTIVLTDSQDTVNDLRFLHGLTQMPTRLTGATGLMQNIGTYDARARDGANRALVLDPLLGVVATGTDRTGGTDDDM